MKKSTCLDTALTPNGKTLSLNEHDGVYSIRVDNAELMSTRRHASEDRLAELACEHVARTAGARVLIGGLGLGFTLRAALSILASDAAVVVAEIMASVIAWNRDSSLPLAADAMADPRVVVAQRDVLDIIRESRGGFDSIMLDVDNGPAALTADDNKSLYSAEGLRLVRAALRGGGCVAFWAAAPDAAFERALARAGFGVKVERCRAHIKSGGSHTIFLGLNGPVRVR